MNPELSVEVPEGTEDLPATGGSCGQIDTVATAAVATETAMQVAPESNEQQQGRHAGKDDQGAEESASKVLRRLSSPIFSAGGGFNSDSDDDHDDGSGGDGKLADDKNENGDGHGGDAEEEDERKEGAAGVLQSWWRDRRRASKRVRAVVAARPAFVRIQQLLDKLDAGQMSFERTGLALQNPDIQRAVTKALASVPRDEALIAMPRASRSARAVLSSLMIVYHPDEVLPTEGDESEGDGGAAAAAASTSTTPPSPTRLGVLAAAASDEGANATQANKTRGRKRMDPVAAALSNASALLLASITAVNASLGGVVAGETGGRKTLEVRLGVLRLSRRYFAVSLVAWKDKDAQRVAAQVVQPYARAYAMRLAAVAQGDERVAEMVQGQLGQYRRALVHLIGDERASNSLQEVELAVRADMGEQAPATPPAFPTAPSAFSAAGGSGEAPVVDTGAPSKKTDTASASTSTSPSSAKNIAALVDDKPRGIAEGTAASPSVPSADAPGVTAPAASSSGAGGGAGGDGYQLPDGRLGRLLGNERLAHEILVNPDFQIPANEENGLHNAAAAAAASPEEELARRFKDVMRRIFWDRFTQSLLPPPSPTTPAAATAAVPAATSAAGSSSSSSSSGRDMTSSDAGAGGGDEASAVVEIPGLPPLKAGSKVHARYGSERGSYYAATVVAVGSSPKSAGGGDGDAATAGGSATTARGASQAGGGGGQGGGTGGGGAAAGGGAGVYVDVRYDEDGMVERGVPVSRLKKTDDPPDFGPLLALLGEVREELISLTPNNAVLVGEVRGVLSQERLAEMLREKTLDARQVQRLVGFISGRILELQAPVRSDGARAWLKSFEAKMEAASASGDPLAIIPLLPRAFEFVFSQMEEIKRDSANAHIRLIAPYLARHGAAYERAMFEARLSSSNISLERTKVWLSSAVEGFLSGDAEKGGTGDEGERSRRAKGLRDGREEVHKSVLRQAFVGLLRSPVRLDRPDAKITTASGVVLPETLDADGGRLAAARDDVDRVTLIATLCILVRQVLARLRIGCSAPAMAALQAKTSSLLKQEGVFLPQIVEECVATARRLAGTPGEGTPPKGLPPSEEEGLRSLLVSSANPKNEVFRVFFKRVLLALKGMLAAGGGGAADDVCGRNGLQSFTEELRPVGTRLHRLFAHNVKVHAGHYGPIVTDAATRFPTSS